MKKVSMPRALPVRLMSVALLVICFSTLKPILAIANTTTSAAAIKAGSSQASAADRTEHRYTHEQKQELADHALHILGGNANVIARWEGDIRLALVATASTEIRQHVKDLVADIAEITELQGRVLEGTDLSPQDYLSLVQGTQPYDLSLCESETECANLVVVISDIETVRKLSTAIPLRQVYQRSVAGDSKPYCFFAPFVNGMMNIKQGFVFVRDDLGDAMTRTCLQEEIFQTFGLFNDASGSEWFSFNNRVEPKSITTMDRLLLQTVYSSELGAGTPAYVVVRKFLQKLDDVK